MELAACSALLKHKFLVVDNTTMELLTSYYRTNGGLCYLLFRCRRDQPYLIFEIVSGNNPVSNSPSVWVMVKDGHPLTTDISHATISVELGS